MYRIVTNKHISCKRVVIVEETRPYRMSPRALTSTGRLQPVSNVAVQESMNNVVVQESMNNVVG